MARFLATRDEGAFRALYRMHTPALLLFARRVLGGSQHEAEEAVQEAWVRAVRQLAGFRGESSLRTWLHGITLNCCRELMRSRTPRSSAPTDEKEPPAPPRADHLDVEALLQALPDGYREVLVLHDLEGYTHEEIAQRLSIAPGTSKSQLSRARSFLRAWLDQRREGLRSA